MKGRGENGHGLAVILLVLLACVLVVVPVQANGRVVEAAFFHSPT